MRVRNESEARAACIHVIKVAWRDWDGTGDFITFLGARYTNPAADPVGNRNWVRNVRSIYRQLAGSTTNKR